MIESPTGTGKTLAYILPIINNLKLNEKKSLENFRDQNLPRAIVFSPSRELMD